MSSSPGWAQRVVVVLLMTTAATAVMVLSAGSASAHHCQKPNEPGNVGANVGGVATVGVDQNNIGTTEHDVIVCADPPHQEAWVDVRDLDPAKVGVQVGVGTCGLLGCTGVGYTGAEAPIPSTSVDYPLDGNNLVGASVNMGSGVCPWVNGSPSTCQLGGTSNNTFSGGDPGPPPPVHPTVDPFVSYMFYEALYGVPNYESWCTQLLFQGWHVDEMAVFCTIMITNRLVWWPLDALLP